MSYLGTPLGPGALHWSIEIKIAGLKPPQSLFWDLWALAWGVQACRRALQKKGFLGG